MKRRMAVLALPVIALALPLQAQVGVHGAVARDLWDRDEGFEEMYFLAGISWTPGRWQYRVSAAAHVLQSDSSLRLGGEVSAMRLFYRDRRLAPLLGLGATLYQADTTPREEKGIGAALLLIGGMDLLIVGNLHLRVEYRGVYGIFPSALVGLTLGSRSP